VKFFVARITGDTTTLPVTDAGAVVSSASAPDTQPLQALFDSKFIPTEWQIRLDATHAKSKTYRRDAALA